MDHQNVAKYFEWFYKKICLQDLSKKPNPWPLGPNLLELILF